MRRIVLPLVTLILAGLFATLGTVGLRRADEGTDRRTDRVDGLPVTVVTPAGVSGRLPAVVVAHGFAGSGRLMAGFADTLARRGFVVALLDFTGHGANPHGLPEGFAATLRRDLGTAVGHLRRQSTVDPDRIGLVGHSMGAGAVVDYAARDSSIRATVAISLGAEDFGRPRELLVLYGALEFAGFRQAADAALRTGAARRVVEVPGVEHISVLFASRTHEETASWLDAALAGGAGAGVRPRARLVPAALLVLGFVLGFVALALLSPGRGGTSAAPDPPVAWWWVPLAVLAAVPAGWLAGWLPISVGDYAAGYFAVTGAALLAARRRLPRWPGASPWSVPLLAFAVPAVVVPVHLGLTHAVPVGPRWWILPVVVACCWLFLLGVELAAGGRPGRHAALLALSVAGLLGGATVGVAPGFVVLVVPLLVLLLVWHAGWAAVLRTRGAPAWLIAGVGAVVLAWPVATTLPLSA